jgi:SM-20-related protein
VAVGNYGAVVSDLVEAVVPELIEALRSDGWYCRPQFLDAATIAALRADLSQRRTEFTAAAIGRAQQRHQQAAIRSDATLWLSGAGAAQYAFLAAMEELRVALNRHLYLGLNDYEAHYAHYAAGAFYSRHLDVFQSGGSANDSTQAPRRVLSTVCYLNDAWRSEQGGALVLWDGDDREITQIMPSAGTAVFFLSAEFPHEVRPALAERYSIAGWFRSQGGL